MFAWLAFTLRPNTLIRVLSCAQSGDRKFGHSRSNFSQSGHLQPLRDPELRNSWGEKVTELSTRMYYSAMLVTAVALTLLALRSFSVFTF